MAAFKHPITGVKLNPIDVERPSLEFEEAVTAWILRMQGTKYQVVAQKLGTNTHRLGEVFRGEKHIGSRAEALRLIAH